MKPNWIIVFESWGKYLYLYFLLVFIIFLLTLRVDTEYLKLLFARRLEERLKTLTGLQLGFT